MMILKWWFSKIFLLTFCLALFYIFFYIFNGFLSCSNEYLQTWLAKGPRLRALFTLASARALAYPNKWGPKEKRCKICFHYLRPSGMLGSFHSGEEEVFNARRILWSRSPWAVKGGLFSSQKGLDFLADISRRYLVVCRRGLTIKREIFKRP